MKDVFNLTLSGVSMSDSRNPQVAIQLSTLSHYIGLLDAMYRTSIVRQEFSVRLAFLYASILKVNQSARSAQVLAEAVYIEEIILLCRTMMETVVNAAYFQYADDLEIDRYLHSDTFTVSDETAFLREQFSAHPPSRSLRAFRDNTVNSVKRMLVRVDEPSWSTKTLVQRAALSDKSNETPVMGLLLQTMHARTHAASRNTFSSLAPYLNSLDTMSVVWSDGRQVELAEALFGVNLSLMTLAVYLNGFLSLNADDAISAAGSSRLSLRGP